MVENELARDWEFFKKNRELLGIARKKRCFILACGPSMKNQDLDWLREEECISVNFFHKHPSYEKIRPRFHIFSGLKLHPNIPSHIGNFLMARMNEECLSEKIFLEAEEKKIVEEQGLFKNKDVFYFKFSKSGCSGELDVDPEKTIYLPNVCAAAIQMAYIMGFKEIYLVGADHNFLLTRLQNQQQHFASYEEYHGASKAELDDEKTPLVDLFENCAMLWRFYVVLKDYLSAKGVSVYNATEGGILDVFERVKFQSLREMRESEIEKI